jgi:hypothetical protein
VVVVALYHLPTSALRDLTSAQQIATHLGKDEVPSADVVDRYAEGEGVGTPPSARR